jgi:hypothetical protein
MSFALLVTAALIGPHAPLSADDWRDEYKAALLATTEQAKPRPADAVPRLVSLYVSLEHVESLPRGERTRMRQTLQSRLVKQLEDLLREQRKHELTRQKTAKRVGSDSQAGGGATVFAAQQLINLIVTTIAPDSWKQNGGKGSISFYARNPALVIRQTSEVHGEMADLLRALRP